MNIANSDELSGDIQLLVRQILEQGGAVAALDKDDALAAKGMTSMGMVTLMLGIEAKFRIMIPAEFLTPEHFHSLATIENMVASLVAKRPMTAAA